MRHIQEVLIKRFEGCDESNEAIENLDYVEMYLSANQIGGCSVKPLITTI